MPSIETTPLGDRLKTETGDMHTRAEKSPMQAALVQGRLPRDGYAAWLGQMLFVHEALDHAVASARARHPGVAAVAHEGQFKAPLVREDLASLDVDVSGIAPGPATARVVEMIERTSGADPVAALGLHYVLEGANNGNQFIARVIRKAYALEGERGTRSLDPYGPRQREVWASFKQALNAQEFTEAERDRIVESAKDMFRAVTEISEELWASFGKAG